MAQICNDLYIDHNSDLSVQFRNGINILTINIHSFKHKFPAFLGYLNYFNVYFSFIVLTEVWLSDELYNEEGFGIPGYKSVSCLRNEFGGGILIYYRDSFQVQIIETLSGLFNSHESLFINCFLPNYGDFNLWSFYRPPRNSARQFVDYLHNNLDFITNKRAVLTGDFNLDVMKDDSPVVTDLIDILASFGFSYAINKPTHFSTETGSCLDNFWYNLKLPISSYVVSPPLADHMGIILSINANNDNNSRIECIFRDFSCRNKLRFCNNVDFECNQFNIESDDINVETCKFITWMTYLANKYFPLKRKYISKKRFFCPWITTPIKKCIDKKLRWFRLLKAKVITYNSYRRYCGLLRCLLKTAEREYYYKKFKSFGGDSKKN